MLVLSSLHELLSQVLSLPSLHTAVLFTPEGQLVSYASAPCRPKDEIRVVVGISGEIWQETKQQGIGMVDSELGRVLVLPILPLDDKPPTGADEEDEPAMLVALNANDTVEWDEMRMKAKELVYYLEKPVSQLRGRLAGRVNHPAPKQQPRPSLR